jgi:hypothetical protein
MSVKCVSPRLTPKETREEQERQLALLVFRFKGNGWATQAPQIAADPVAAETAESAD